MLLGGVWQAHTMCWWFAGMTVAAFTAPSAVRKYGSISFINPLEVDGFAEPGGWGFHKDPSKLPLLVFLPGMDGSLATPFMQYAEVHSASPSRLCRLLLPYSLIWA